MRNRKVDHAFATKFTREGVLDMTNRKPYRTASQKEEARRTARLCKDGTYRSSAPVSYHHSTKTN